MTEQTLRKEIFPTYKQTLDKIRQLVALFYEKYAVDGKVSLADAMKYDRLNKLEADIQKELKLLGKAQVKQTRQLLKDVYVESFARAAYGIENQVARLGD
jgi:hypothetical protein